MIVYSLEVYILQAHPTMLSVISCCPKSLNLRNQGTSWLIDSFPLVRVLNISLNPYLWILLHELFQVCKYHSCIALFSWKKLFFLWLKHSERIRTPEFSYLESGNGKNLNAHLTALCDTYRQMVSLVTVTVWRETSFQTGVRVISHRIFRL